MTDISEMRDHLALHGALPGVDDEFTLYYDETNNIRRLLLTDNGFNIDRPGCFVVGGMAYRGAPRAIDFPLLRSALKLQPSVKELKFKHLAQGPFLRVLQSRKIGTLLQWIGEQGFALHYQVVDLLYWSLVDVVDSILTEAEEPMLYPAHRLLKDALYKILRVDHDATAALLGRYNYPNVGRGQRMAFIGDLLLFLEVSEPTLPHFEFQMLKGLLQIGRGLDRLPYLEGECPNTLIQGFGPFFANRLCLFRNSRHILDHEQHIEGYIRTLDLTDHGTPVRHFRFADSCDEVGIQISDALVGLLGKLFAYLEQTPVAEIADDMAELDELQIANLSQLARLMDKSTDICPAFAQFVISDEDRHRAAFLLEGEILEESGR